MLFVARLQPGKRGATRPPQRSSGGSPPLMHASSSRNSTRRSSHQSSSDGVLVLRPSSFDGLDGRIELGELDACIGRRETPMDGRLSGIPIGFPSSDLSLETRLIRNAALEALPCQYTQLDFGHV